MNGTWDIASDNFVVIEPSVGAIQDEITMLERLVEEFGAENAMSTLADNVVRLRVKMEMAAITLPEPLAQRLARLEAVVKRGPRRISFFQDFWSPFDFSSLSVLSKLPFVFLMSS